MADNIRMTEKERALREERAREDEVSESARAAGGRDSQVRQGGINQGQGSGAAGALNDSAPEDEALRLRRQSQGDLVDDNAASHQGGFGVQSGQADYGSAGNLAGMGKARDKALPGSNPR